MEVAERVHRLTRGVTNFYLIEEGGKLVLIDAGTPRDWDLLVKTITEISRQLDALDTVLLTHSHADHTGFAERARSTTGARVWIHKGDEHAVTTGELEKADGKMRSYLLKAQMYKTMLSLGRRGASKVVPVHEVSTFQDGEMLDVPGHPRVIHAPGHTEGTCALFLEGRRILFAGDVLTTWNPLTGTAGPQIMPSAMNEDTPQALRSLEALDEISAEVMLPGHGEPWTRGVDEALRLARAAGPS
jgi:glyoxylase-like metal-dependent hydrolase (beta-lactamase superfamily II)